jgi:hypothetical protein
MATSSRNRHVLEKMFGADSFQSPEFEYELRAEDFVAEIPQSGERFESREALRAMQEGFGDPPTIQLKRITGEGDTWVVEAIQTYGDASIFHVCALVEFTDGKISRETRYYAPPLAADRPRVPAE